jgi:5-formyltetrahydrofolate cyclo-ligase
MTDTSSPEDDKPEGTFSSPPCYMHEFYPDQSDAGPDAARTRDVALWRAAERKRLIALRLALPSSERAEHSRLVADDLFRLIPQNADTIVSLYWPFRGEPDLRPVMTWARAAGLRAALPVVVAKGQPLVFREWTPDSRFERGVWNIPFPADGDEVTATVVVAPLVGFDLAGFRLGYGGGFFDRTLAGMSKKPLVIGVGHPTQQIPTIYPQPHDIPMDWIVTGQSPPRHTVVGNEK